MRHSVVMNLRIATQANANGVRNAIENLITAGTGREIEEPVTAMPYHAHVSAFLVNASVFCPNEADAIALFTGVVSTWTAGPQSNRILAGSWVKRVYSFADEGLSDQVVDLATKA